MNTYARLKEGHTSVVNDVLSKELVPGRQAPQAWTLPSVLGGLTIVAAVREGAFWPADAFVVAVAALLILALELLLERPAPRTLAVVWSLLLLDALWLVRAATAGTPETFLPLGASIIGFSAAAATSARLSSRAKVVVGQVLAALGGVLALIGFAGLSWRWFPIAMPAQGLWRLSSTLTYSDAAGLVLAVCLLVGLANDKKAWTARLSVCLCAAGLLATQSRGAYVAFLLGCAFVPLQQYRRFLVPLSAGIALGATSILTSPSPNPVPWLGVAVFAACAASVAWVPSGGAHLGTRTKKALLACVVLSVAVGAMFALHHEIGLRALSPSDQDRTVEWSAALRQFDSSPLVGVGPDRLLQFHASDGTYAHFAHNEYLQVAADVGLAGLALVGLVAIALLRAIRRVDLMTSCAAAALVCWCAGGAFDFDWHLPFIGLLGGWVTGLAIKGEQ